MNLPIIREREGSDYWYMDWHVVKDGKHKRIKKSLRKYDLRKDRHTHEQALAELLVHLGISDKAPQPGTMTLAQFIEHVARRQERKGLRPATTKETRVALAHLRGFLGDRFLAASLTRADAARFQGHLLDKGMKPVTVNKTFRHCRQAFGVLLDDGAIDRNPFARIPQLREYRDGPRHLTRDQVNALLTAARDSGRTGYYHLMVLAAHTGLRRTEILGIERAGIDLEHSRLRVANVKRHDRRQRWIRIDQAVAESLAWFIEHGAPGEHPCAICSPDWFSDQFKVYAKAAGLPPSLTLHSLRHTWVTLTGERGVDLWRIQRHVDHTSARTTEGYFHPDADLGDAIGPGY